MKELCEKYKVNLDGMDFGIMKYNEELKRYENQYGNIPLDKMILILQGDKDYDFIKIESIEE